MVVFVGFGLFFWGRSAVKDELADYQTHKLSFYSKEVQLIGCHYVE